MTAPDPRNVRDALLEAGYSPEEVERRALLRRLEDGCTPEPNTGCWLWLGSVGRTRYGAMSVNGRRTLAHRVSFELHHGPIPGGFCVCHRCDIPICVNPAHLFLGTQADNMRDMAAKNRKAIGERNGHAKLSDDDVRLVLSLAGIEMHRTIAARFGVERSTITGIISRRHRKRAATGEPLLAPDTKRPASAEKEK
jgi:hypothetical protein